MAAGVPGKAYTFILCENPQCPTLNEADHCLFLPYGQGVAVG